MGLEQKRQANAEAILAKAIKAKVATDRWRKAPAEASGDILQPTCFQCQEPIEWVSVNGQTTKVRPGTTRLHKCSSQRSSTSHTHINHAEGRPKPEDLRRTKKRLKAWRELDD